MEKSTKKALVIAGVTVTLGAGGFIGYTLIKNKRIRAEQFRIFASDNDIIKALDGIKDGEKYKEFNKKYQVRLTDLSKAKSKRAFEEAGEALNELLDEIKTYIINHENEEKIKEEEDTKDTKKKKKKNKKKKLTKKEKILAAAEMMKNDPKMQKAKEEWDKEIIPEEDEENTEEEINTIIPDNKEITDHCRIDSFINELFFIYDYDEAVKYIIETSKKCPDGIEDTITEKDYDIIGDEIFILLTELYDINEDFIRENRVVQSGISLYLKSFYDAKNKEEDETEEFQKQIDKEMEEEIYEEDVNEEEAAATDDEDKEEINDEISEEEEVEEENEEGECQNEVSNTTDEENEKDEGSEEGLIKDIGGVKVDFTADSDEDDEESEYVEKENLKDLLSKSMVEDEEDENDNVKKNEKSVEKEEEIVERPTKKDFEENHRIAYFDMIKYRKDILNSTTYNIKERFQDFNDSIHILNTKEHYGYYHECLEVIFNILVMNEPEEHTLTRLDTFFKEFDKLVKPVIEKRIKDITTIAR